MTVNDKPMYITINDHEVSVHDDAIYVVELHDDTLLGMVEIDKTGDVYVYSGFAGHPHILSMAEVVSMIPASRHPEVVQVKAGAK
jgi:hypothetical protein